MAGTLIQSVARNPLASPDVIGITQGAGLAATVALTSGMAAVLVAPTALVGGLLAAVLLFALSGQVLWLLGASMAVGAMAGGWLGSHTAMRYGAKLIRPLLVTASIAMTARLLWGYFSGG